MPIPGKKGDKNARKNDVDMINSTFVNLMSWKYAEAEKEGEAFTESSGKEPVRDPHSADDQACWAWCDKKSSQASFSQRIQS